MFIGALVKWGKLDNHLMDPKNQSKAKVNSDHYKKMLVFKQYFHQK